MNNQSAKLTKEQLQRQVVLPTIYKEVVERAIVNMFALDDVDEALCSNYFRDEVASYLSESELCDDDKLQQDEYSLQAIWFLTGWQARRRMEVQNEDIAKTISKAIRR